MASLQQRYPGLPGSNIREGLPPRSSSYRALSIIDSYRAGYEEPPPPEPLPKDAAQTVSKTIQSLRGQHINTRSIYQDIDEAYGSGEAEPVEEDMGDVAVLSQQNDYIANKGFSSNHVANGIANRQPKLGVAEKTKITPPLPPLPKTDDDYDPFRPPSPPPKSAPKKLPSMSNLKETAKQTSSTPALVGSPKGSVMDRWKQMSKSTPHVNMVGSPLTPSKDKALPSVPRKLSKADLPPRSPPAALVGKKLPSIPAKMSDEVSGTDSVLESEKETTATRPATQEIQSLPKGPMPVSTRASGDEKIFQATRSISRKKPPSLFLNRSNGSTAASVSSASTSTATSDVPVRNPYHQDSEWDKLLPHAKIKAGQNAGVAPASITPSRVVTTSDATAATTTLRSAPEDSPAVGISNFVDDNANRPTSSDNDASLADDEDALEDQSMNRIKNLVKRKPVGGGNISNNKDKENSSRRNSPTKSHAPLQSPQQQIYLASNSRHIRGDSQTIPISPASASKPSLEQFPPLDQTLSSTETIIHSPTPEHGRPTTPPLLRSPTPLSQLEVSPSKYGIKKKSERNLRRVDEERNSQMFSPGANGVLRFFSAQRDLSNCFTQEDPPTSPIFDPNVVVANEAARMSFYHASLLDWLRERPRDSNAPQLSTTQLHCLNDHQGQWYMDKNEVHPVNCAICDTEEHERWSCSSCGLRTCPDCRAKLMARSDETPYRQILKDALEEGARKQLEWEAERAARHRSNTIMTERTITQSRPGSPVVYPPTNPNTPYENPRAVSSTHSLPGNVRPRRSHEGVRLPPSSYRGHLQNLPLPPYGRPNHSARTSISSAPAFDIPPTPRIPDQYAQMPTSRIPGAHGELQHNSDPETRGRHLRGMSSDRGRMPVSAGSGRYGSPLRGQTKARSRSRPRPGRNGGMSAGLAPPSMAEQLGRGGGPYPSMPGGTAGPGGRNTPGSFR